MRTTTIIMLALLAIPGCVINAEPVESDGGALDVSECQANTEACNADRSTPLWCWNLHTGEGECTAGEGCGSLGAGANCRELPSVGLCCRMGWPL